MKTLLMGIDFQKDFMDDGSLPVPGGYEDARRFANLIQRADFDEIILSLDTHREKQIFHPMWWEDRNKNHPEPFTVITADDVKQGKWIPRYLPKESLEYLRLLEKNGKRNLIIWTYHCLLGSSGVCLEETIAKTVHEKAKTGAKVTMVQKGMDPLTEMYGIFKPEVEFKASSNELLEQVCEYDRIVIGGEAKSHCVLESVKQLVDYCIEKRLKKEIILLSDCMHSIPGFENETENEFEKLSERYPIQWIESAQLGNV